MNSKCQIDVIILCGGTGSRLDKFVRDKPKILLELGGFSILEYQLNLLKGIKYSRLFLATHFHSKKIENKCKELNIANYYIAKCNSLLDTGGAVSDVVRKYGPLADDVLILNGDILTDINLNMMFETRTLNYNCVMATVNSNNAKEFGLVKVDNRNIKGFEEKQNNITTGVINAGIYLFSNKLIRNLPNKRVFSLEKDVFPFLDCFYSYMHDGIWHDVGNYSRFKSAISDLNKFK